MKEKILNLNQAKIPVIYEYSSASPIISLKIIFKNAGQVSQDKNGLANLLAKLLNEGSKKQGSISFNHALEIKAIELSVSSTSESMIFEVECLKEHFAFALKMLIELLNGPNFDDEILAMLKAKILGKIAAKKSDFDYQASLKLSGLLFANTPFASAAIGDEASINDISLDDLRDFYEKKITLNNAFIVFGGDVSFEELDLNGLNLKSGEIANIKKFCVNENLANISEQRESKQAFIYFGSPFNVEKNERYKANVAMFVLGSSGFGSRLLEQIRVKRGLAYSAYAHANFLLYRSFLSGYLQTKNESKDEAIALVSEIFKNFVKNGISADELNGAKKFLLGNEPLSKETFFKRLNIAQQEYYMGYKLGYFDENLKKIAKLNLKDINDFISAHSEICSLSFASIYGKE